MITKSLRTSLSLVGGCCLGLLASLSLQAADDHGSKDHRAKSGTGASEQSQPNSKSSSAPSSSKSSAAPNSPAAGTMAAAALAAGDREFVMKAADSNMTEILASRAALERSSNEKVKMFAQHMVEDHEMAGNEMKALAKTKGLTLPTTVTEPHQKALDKLAKTDAAKFDVAYMTQMVADHEKTVELFEDASEDAKDADLKAMATKKLPILREHLRMARDIRKSLDS